MKKKLAIFFGIMVLASLAYLVYLQAYGVPQEEKEIAMPQFISKMNSTTDVSTLMHFGADTSQNRLVINCTIGLARSLGSLGKKVSNYAFENNYCVTPEVSNSTPAECYKAMGQTYRFDIKYGPPGTKFFERHAEIYVDETFQQECGIGFVDGSSS
jgi:hypothetical protein